MMKLSVSFGSVDILARPTDTHGFADAGNKKQQRDARIAHQIAQAVDSVVAAPIGYQQSVLVDHPDETRRIAARRTIEALGTARRQHHERRGFDQLAIFRRDVIGFLDDDGP